MSEAAFKRAYPLKVHFVTPARFWDLIGDPASFRTSAFTVANRDTMYVTPEAPEDNMNAPMAQMHETPQPLDDDTRFAREYNALWGLMGYQAGKVGCIPLVIAAQRARRVMNDTRDSLSAPWETFAAEVLKRWRVEMCTMILERGRHA